MRTIIYTALIIATMAIACKPKVDTTRAKSEISDQMDKYWTALLKGDITSLEVILTDDGLFCGTDPRELLDKKGYLNLTKETLSDTTIKWKYLMKKRDIRFVGDGSAAISLDQFSVPVFSPKIEFRLVAYWIKTNNIWKINFLSIGAIPLNEDFEKLNKALE